MIATRFGRKKVSDPNCREPALRVLRTIGVRHFFSFVASLTVGMVASAIAAEPNTHLLIVVGADGTPEYGDQFRAWADQWQTLGKRAGASVTLLSSEPAMSSRDELSKELSELAIRADDGSVKSLWLVLIGHGTFQAGQAKFNLTGPDMTADELAGWLKPFAVPCVIVNCASSSGPFVNALSADDRIIVTATKSGQEQNFARIGEYLPAALNDPAADLDHDDEVSLLEAVLKAASETQRFYLTEGRIVTEHAMVDDNGDSLGTPAALLQSVFRATSIDRGAVTKGAKKDSPPPTLDGPQAARAILVPATDSAKLSPAESTQRDEIEAEITELKRRKTALGDDAFYKQLEKAMLKLARIYQSAEKRAETAASSP